MKTFALAFGGGGARGLAHIVVLEALDEIGARPVAIAGTSIGALIGAAYASGMSGRDIRRHVIALAHNRGRGFPPPDSGAGRHLRQSLEHRLRQRDSGRRGEILQPVPAGQGAGRVREARHSAHRDRLRSLARRQTVFSTGTLKPALAASIALPTVMRPVVVEGRVLIDGGGDQSAAVRRTARPGRCDRSDRHLGRAHG